MEQQVQLARLFLYYSTVASQPPRVVCKMEAQLEYVHVAHTFLHVLRRFVCSVGAYQQDLCFGAQSEVYYDCVVS